MMVANIRYSGNFANAMIKGSIRNNKKSRKIEWNLRLSFLFFVKNQQGNFAVIGEFFCKTTSK